VRYKRPFDLAILVGAHLVLAPLWLLLWVAIPVIIKLQDRGPIFYGQSRVGTNGRIFQVLKFRSMVPDADQIGPAWNVSDDARVTAFGRLLRKTALDELPQLLSILRGDMSFVGPKPLAVAEHEQLVATIPGFDKRIAVRPGLTGLAQVYNGRDESERKLELDLEYAQRMGLLLDVKLLLLSVRNTLLARWDTREGKPSGNGEEKRD
jgi:lipopolysaccharide/colanic/teichoic acid biosynthesis glycosyltransferase